MLSVVMMVLVGVVSGEVVFLGFLGVMSEVRGIGERLRWELKGVVMRSRMKYWWRRLRGKHVRGWWLFIHGCYMCGSKRRCKCWEREEWFEKYGRYVRDVMYKGESRKLLLLGGDCGICGGDGFECVVLVDVEGFSYESDMIDDDLIMCKISWYMLSSEVKDVLIGKVM